MSLFLILQHNIAGCWCNEELSQIPKLFMFILGLKIIRYRNVKALFTPNFHFCREFTFLGQPNMNHVIVYPCCHWMDIQLHSTKLSINATGNYFNGSKERSKSEKILVFSSPWHLLLICKVSIATDVRCLNTIHEFRGH